jgi:hypothetical protein
MRLSDPAFEILCCRVGKGLPPLGNSAKMGVEKRIGGKRLTNSVELSTTREATS